MSNKRKCHSSFIIRRSSFDVRHSSFVVRHLSFVVCYLIGFGHLLRVFEIDDLPAAERLLSIARRLWCLRIKRNQRCARVLDSAGELRSLNNWFRQKE